jgi:hypothetical protein
MESEWPTGDKIFTTQSHRAVYLAVFVLHTSLSYLPYPTLPTRNAMAWRVAYHTVAQYPGTQPVQQEGGAFPNQKSMYNLQVTRVGTCISNASGNVVAAAAAAAILVDFSGQPPAEFHRLING